MAMNQHKVKLIFQDLFRDQPITLHPALEEGYLFIEEICHKYNLAVKPKEFVKFGAHVFSLLPRKEWFIAVSMLIVTWEVDDILDLTYIDLKEKYNVLDSVQNLLTTGQLEPYTGGAHLLRDTLNKIKCNHLKQYFSDSYAEYLAGIREHLDDYGIFLVSDEILCDTAKFCKFRQLDCGCDFTFSLLYLDVDCFAKIGNFINSDIGKKMWLAAITHVLILNDVLSLEKDKSMGIKGNYVISWMKQYAKTEEESIDDLLNKGRTLLDALESIHLSGDDDDVLNKVILWCKGHIIWASSTPRYS